MYSGPEPCCEPRTSPAAHRGQGTGLPEEGRVWGRGEHGGDEEGRRENAFHENPQRSCQPQARPAKTKGSAPIKSVKELFPVHSISVYTAEGALSGDAKVGTRTATDPRRVALGPRVVE